MIVKVRGKFRIIDALIEKLKNGYLIDNIQYPEAYKYCSTFGGGTVLFELSDFFTDFYIFHRKRFANLDIRIEKKSIKRVAIKQPSFSKQESSQVLGEYETLELYERRISNSE